MKTKLVKFEQQLKNDDLLFKIYKNLGWYKNLDFLSKSRRSTNYFSSGIWKYGFYNKLITLHYEITNENYDELLENTYGNNVFFGEYGSDIQMPQEMPNKFLKSIIICCSDHEKEEITKIVTELLPKYKIENISVLYNKRMADGKKRKSKRKRSKK